MEDARYVQQTHFPDFELTDFAMAKGTRLKQQRIILDLFHYRYCEEADRQKLPLKAQQVAKVDSKPIYIFRELIHYLAEQQLVVPGYTLMQDTVGQALHHEQNRLIMVATTQLTDSDKAELNKLLSNPNGLYEITRLKREPKDFSNQEIAQEISRGKQLQALYGVTKRLLPHLGISNESVKYYAWLVKYYSVYQLNQIDDPLVHIYLLCFVYHRYQKLHDNLIRFFIYQVKRYVDEAKNAAKESVYQFRIEQNSNLHKAGQVLRLFTDEAIAGETPFAHIQAQAFAILERQHLVSVANHMVQKASFDEKLFQWEHIDKMANRFKRRLRPVLRPLDFATASANEPLLTAIHFLQAAFRDQKPLSQYEPDRRPLQFIPDHIKRYVYTVDKEGSRHMLMDRYEFLIYRLLRNSLEAGNIFCRDSVRFRSFDEDLVDDELWQEKEILMVNLGLSILNKTAVEHLRELNQLLEERLITVNQRIVAGENEHVKVKKRGKRIRWTLPYPQANDSVNHPLFDTVEQVGIQAIIHFVNSCCHFLGEFTHVLHRYAKQQAADDALVACLVAWGTNMGLGRMGKISDIAYQTLIRGFWPKPPNGSIQIFPQILPLVATLKTRPNRLIFRFLFLSLCL